MGSRISAHYIGEISGRGGVGSSIFSSLYLVKRVSRSSPLGPPIPVLAETGRERIRAHLSLSKITSSPAEQGREDTFFRADIFTSSEYRYSLSLSLPYLETLYLGNKRSREGEHWVPYSREVDLRSAHSLSLCLYVRN